MTLELEERLYTSTEVAEILGVSLRSIYRYLEDGKLEAEVKTATGRHRFTKQNILDFLHPDLTKVTRRVFPAKPEEEERVEVAVREEPEVEEEKAEPVVEKVEEEKKEVDWLAKFRAAAEKHRRELEEEEELKPEAVVEEAPAEVVSGLAAEPEEPVEEAFGKVAFKFYRSGIGGLKDIAQNLDKSSRKASLEYAFTMDAGLSLHKPIRPFSLLHTYVGADDLEYFEKSLKLTESEEGSAQLCLIAAADASPFSGKKEMHGLFVVSDARLRQDLLDSGKEDLAKELE